MPISQLAIILLHGLLKNPGSIVRISRGNDSANSFHVKVLDCWTREGGVEFSDTTLEGALKTAWKAKEDHERSRDPAFLMKEIKGLKEKIHDLYESKESPQGVLRDFPHTADGVPIIVGKTRVFFDESWVVHRGDGPSEVRSSVVFGLSVSINGNPAEIRVQVQQGIDSSSPWCIGIPLSKCYSSETAWKESF